MYAFFDWNGLTFELFSFQSLYFYSQRTEKKKEKMGKIKWLKGFVYLSVWQLFLNVQFICRIILSGWFVRTKDWVCAWSRLRRETSPPVCLSMTLLQFSTSLMEPTPLQLPRIIEVSGLIFFYQSPLPTISSSGS